MANQRSFTGNFSGVRGRFDVNLEVDNKPFVEMLTRLKYSNMVKNKDIRKVFAKVARPVKKTVQQGARASMKRDPRKTWKGVRIITLKDGKGVVVGLLNPKKASGNRMDPPKPNGGRSGIRRNRERSRRTNQVDGYVGADRSFILRMHNKGTGNRMAGTRESASLSRTANRGKLTAKRFFDRAEPAMKQASQSLAQELGNLIKKKAERR